MNVIPAPPLFHGMKRLMDVSNKVGQKFQRLDSVFARRILVAEDLLEHGNSINDAVVMVVFGRRMFLIRAITVAGLGEASCIFRYIHKVPAKGFRTSAFYLVRPIR